MESLRTTPGVGSSRTQTAITSRQGRVLTMLCRCHWGLEVHPSNGSKFSTQWPLGEVGDLQHWCEKPVICENEWSIFGYSWVFQPWPIPIELVWGLGTLEIPRVCHHVPYQNCNFEGIPCYEASFKMFPNDKSIYPSLWVDHHYIPIESHY